MKVAITTCYFDPDYVRSRSLRSALGSLADIEMIVIKNRFRGFLRYPEVLLRILWCRLRQHPDVYLLGFRGQEILPATLLLTRGKPLIFDEFVVPLAWAQESGRQKTLTNRLKSLLAKLSAPPYKHWLRQCRYILTDTAVHAQVSAALSGVAPGNYLAVPVGTDETVFRPSPGREPQNKEFTIFYYGNMLPLHGLKYVLEAALILQKAPVKFVLVGGGQKARTSIEQARQQGANIDYQAWVDFAELPKIIYQADLCLGGPFGDTPQAQRVITGKTYQFLACQRPTLIGEGQASGLFIDKSNSLVVPRADARALADKIQWAVAHQAELPAIALGGRKLYEDHFSLPVIARLLRQLLDAVS